VIVLPFAAGNPKLTTNRPGPPTTDGSATAAGTPAATAGADSSEIEPVPALFVALTSHVYVFPSDNPVTLIGDAGPDTTTVTPPSLDAHDAVYDVIGAPFATGATNTTCITLFPAVIVGAGGNPGTPAGTTTTDAGESGPSPTAFCAFT
jgi:hypothetical protein